MIISYPDIPEVNPLRIPRGSTPEGKLPAEFGFAASAGAVEHCQLCLAPVGSRWKGGKGSPVGFGMLFQWECGLAGVRSNAELAEVLAGCPVDVTAGDRDSGWSRALRD